MALITVMLIIALASLAAADMAVRHHLDVRRMQNREALEQARFVALGAERWAAGILARDRREGDTDNLDEDWATVLPPMPIDGGGSVSGFVEDLQARFNLNNLLTAEGKVSALDVERFQRLLRTLELDPALSLAVQDWIDADLDPSLPAGAEDDYYSALERPYRTANRPFASISELRLVRGVDAQVYAALAPHVTALPARTSINVNTATAAVLSALAEHLELPLAEEFVSQREEQPFDNVEAFTNHSLHGGAEINPAGLSVASENFRSHAQVQLGRVQMTLLSWMQRGGNGVTTVFQRARGEE